jgi:hypothetical protein
MRLPENIAYDMTLSGWLFSRLHNAKLNALVSHSFGNDFIPIGQFSLVNGEAKPVFKASGQQAREALEVLKEGFLSFDRDNFDSDGYIINS